jgi:hypothetical protein
MAFTDRTAVADRHSQMLNGRVNEGDSAGSLKTMNELTYISCLIRVIFTTHPPPLP